MKDLTLIIENVRTFRGRHEIPIRPLTILTGENSSGKTTLLAMFSAVCDQESYPIQPEFNRAPYSLGNFETIASYDPHSGQTELFSLGFRRSNSDSHGIKNAEATYAGERGHILLTSFGARGTDFELSMMVKHSGIDGLSGEAAIRIGGRTFEVPFSGLQVGPGTPLSELVLILAVQPRAAKPAEQALVRAAVNLSMSFRRLAPAGVISLAPTRTQPQRVYSQVTEVYKPSGDHVPYVIEKLMEQEVDGSRGRESFFGVLKTFGQESGLFQEIAVSRLGTKTGVPFELRIGLAGTTINLVDVGYGVSQALPVLVEASTAARDQFVLLQQPEIHLHPRAQAALGTLFAQLVAENHRRLIVETHSDYLIDRVRQEVAMGKIPPDMVGLQYLHREGLETKCHLIELDRVGNLIDPPDYYRSFFLEEEWRLLRRGA